MSDALRGSRDGAPVCRSVSVRGQIDALVLAFAVALLAAPAPAQDQLRVGTGKGLPGRYAEIALTVRDLAGTLLDEGDGPGLEVQGFAIRIEYPAASVTSCDFFQAGVTRGKPTLVASVGRNAGYCYLLFAFEEVAAPLTFRLNRAAPGDLVGNFRIGLSSSLVVGDSFAVTAVAATAILDNGQGTLSETIQNGHLALANGLVQITAEIFRDGFESGSPAAWSEMRPTP